LTYTDENINEALQEYMLRLADDRMILSQRLSELCGHGPILEEDIAMSNIALDLLGQAKIYYEKVAEFSSEETSADDWVFFRDEREYLSVQLVEQDNEDFAHVIFRQLLFDVFEFLLYSELVNSKNESLRAIAEKSIKETKYHLRHSHEWMLRLGGGTEESNRRLREAVELLWGYSGELFYKDEVDEMLIELGKVPDTSKFRDEYYKHLNKILVESELEEMDPNAWMHSGGRLGLHSEFLGRILATMQHLPKSMPDAQW
jgi:ring-1,2-phenylacetyl-CoA epoxidase subunit PaaC